MLQNWSYANYSVKILKSDTQVEKVSFPTGRFDLAPLPATGTPVGEKKKQYSLSPQSVLNQQPL
jgi:hypothetical protein